MTALSDLIARLEAEKEGSRELDIEILSRVLGFRQVAENLFYGPKPEEWTYTLDGDGHPKLPSPTTSLDAALTLVKGYACVVRDEDGRGLVTLTPLDDTFQKGSEGATPALALCIAALTAISSK